MLIPTDVYDKDGNLVRIEYHNEEGEHEFDVVWDPEDEQTSENRIKLRKWATKMLKQKGFEVHE